MTIWEMSLLGSAVILATVILRLLALRRLPSGVFLALWSLALIRLLLPLRCFIPIPTKALEYMAVGAQGVVLPSPSPVLGADAASYDSSSNWLLYLWAAIALGIFLWFVVVHIRTRRIYGFAVPVQDERVLSWVRKNALKRRRVKIRVSADITAPLTYGLFRPVILLPKSAESTGQTSLEHMLTHEMVHIRRLDVLWKWLLLAAASIHWFNPLVWLMHTLANRDLEISCDVRTVHILGCDRASYARTLLELADSRTKIPNLGSAFGKNAVEERMKLLMKARKASVLAVIAAVVVLIGATSVFAAVRYEIPEPVPTEPPQTTEEVPSEPLSGEALQEYRESGALEVDSVPYLPLVATAESLGYTVEVDSHKTRDGYIEGYINVIEYSYELFKDGKSLGVACIDIAEGKVLQCNVDQIFCQTSLSPGLTNFVLYEDTVYMPAQFFKEALDDGNVLP